jgi:hypothetical protein
MIADATARRMEINLDACVLVADTATHGAINAAAAISRPIQYSFC